MASGVYVIEHIASGRRYVGSAVSLAKRWKEHRRQLEQGRHHSRFLQRAWDKHGADAFAFRVALYCNRENLLAYEQALIDFYRPEYNSAPTAGSQLGLKMSDEAKAKMSLAAKRTRNFTGHRHSEESKRQISAKKTGVCQSREVVDRRTVAIASRGVWPASRRFTDEQIRAIRKAIENGTPQKSLCAAYAVSSSVISEINTRKAYRWVA